MHDPLVVRRRQAARDLQCEVERLADRQGRAADALPERLPFQQLGDGVGHAGFDADIVNRQDVRMRERGDRLGLALEAGERGGIGGQPLGQDLDRDIAIEARVAGAVDLTHPPGADRSDDLVGAEAGAGCEWHGGSQYSDRPHARASRPCWWMAAPLAVRASGSPRLWQSATRARPPTHVIPAQAGIRRPPGCVVELGVPPIRRQATRPTGSPRYRWTPAFAGVTLAGGRYRWTPPLPA